MSGSRPTAAPPSARRSRLSRSADFDAVARLGRSAANRHLTLRYRRRDDGEPARVGYAVPRKVGGAVERNAVKRRLREAVAREESLLAPGTDYVLVARPGLAGALEAQGFAWLVECVREVLREAAER